MFVIGREEGKEEERKGKKRGITDASHTQRKTGEHLLEMSCPQ